MSIVMLITLLYHKNQAKGSRHLLQNPNVICQTKVVSAFPLGKQRAQSNWIALCIALDCREQTPGVGVVANFLYELRLIESLQGAMRIALHLACLQNLAYSFDADMFDDLLFD